jgi:Rhabdovirus nucleocapsid protein
VIQVVQENWTSFDLVIGEKVKKAICPLDLLEVGVRKIDVPKMYRNRSGKAESVALMTTSYIAWANDRQYQVLCAAIDMFLFRYNTHDRTILRMGTIHLRDKDGSARVAFNTFPLKNDLRLMEFCRAVYVLAIGKELYRMVQKRQGMEDPHSYSH